MRMTELPTNVMTYARRRFDAFDLSVEETEKAGQRDSKKHVAKMSKYIFFDNFFWHLKKVVHQELNFRFFVIKKYWWYVT